MDIPIIFTSKVKPTDIRKVTDALRANGATSARNNTGPIVNHRISSRIRKAYEAGKSFIGFDIKKTGDPMNMYILKKAL